MNATIVEQSPTGSNPLYAQPEKSVIPAIPKTHHAWVDRVVTWGENLLFKDYEAQLDFSAKVTGILDWGAFGVIVGVEATSIANKLFSLKLDRVSVLSKTFTLFQILTIPFSIFFVAINALKTFFEFVHLKRGIQLLKKVEREGRAEEKFEWIRSKYFSLSAHENTKITSFIEENLSDLDPTEKRARFEQLKEKALALKLNNLGRRITPALAKEVKTQLDIITRDLKKPSTQAQALQRAEVLMQSISSQAKHKIVVHIIGLAALAMSLVGLIATLSGVGAIPIFVTAIALALLQFAVEKKTVGKAVVRLYDALATYKLPKIKLPEQVAAIVPPSYQGALSQNYNWVRQELDHRYRTATDYLYRQASSLQSSYLTYDRSA